VLWVGLGVLAQAVGDVAVGFSAEEFQPGQNLPWAFLQMAQWSI
jgi:hypothetical protein